MNKSEKDPFQCFPNYYNKNNICEEMPNNKKITNDKGDGPKNSYGLSCNYPFQYFPNYYNTEGLKENILKTIKLNSDIIEIGRGNKKVKLQERRKTAWLSNNEKLTFEYSGKVMIPEKIPDYFNGLIEKIKEDFGLEFDGILINYYPDGSTNMGYHSDPIDEKWSNDFIVFSIGAHREFIFRENENRDNKIKFDFNDGDIIYMYDNCQEKYEHSVKKSKEIDKDRISIVFKKSI